MNQKGSGWRSRHVLILVAMVLGAQAAIAGTKTVAANCPGCLTVDDMIEQAWLEAAGAIDNTNDDILFLMVSDTYPVSGYFRLVWYSDYVEGYGSYRYPDMHAVTIDLDSAIALDNMLFTRAAGVPPITVPVSIAGTVTDVAAPELLSQFVQQTLVQVGIARVSWWRSITNLRLAPYIVYIDTRTGATREVYIGDTIILRFADGSTVQMRLMSFAGTVLWKVVDGSERDANGDPIVASIRQTGVTPVPGGGTVAAFNPGGSVTYNPVQFCRVDMYYCSSSIVDDANGRQTVIMQCERRYSTSPC
ncbi:MAG: hypothetical protein CMLOHMNK_01270 [Steroidobacteraceae bacterium]|nr:hypothetical protein [Steroidobacteraceae bacterium]